MYREAAVLSQLGHHPCIVHFYGLVVEQLAPNVKESHQHAALSASSFTGSFTGSSTQEPGTSQGVPHRNRELHWELH
jgi:hypothetical protein